MQKLIAVVDDEPDIVELVTHRLEKEGFKVKGFYDGKGLLDYIRTTLPDLIILDLMIPEVDGLEVCRVLKKSERTSSVPIIMLTAKGTETDRVVGLELGADDYMVKPFSPRELLARVKAVLRRVEGKAEKRKVININLEFTVYVALPVSEAPHLHAFLRVVCILVHQFESSE